MDLPGSVSAIRVVFHPGFFPVITSAAGGHDKLLKFPVVSGKEHLSEKTENEELTLEMMNAGPDDRLGCVARILGDVAVELPD